MQENRPAEQDPNSPNVPNQPEHSSRTWRACCLVPTLALALILLIGVAASLYSPARRGAGRGSEGTQPGDQAVQARRDAFVQFGRRFFSIATKADDVSGDAFRAMQAKFQGNGSLDAVHEAFRKAADANGEAATEFKALSIPSNLDSQDKLRLSISNISRAYALRRDICRMLVRWNGDTQDKATADQYSAQSQEVNRLTREGLRYIAEAARDNQLTREDVRKILPANAESMKLDTVPWK